MNIAQFKRWLGIYGSGSGGPVSWGSISGKPSFSTVAFSGDYNDLANRPSGTGTGTGTGSTAWADITGKPSLAAVATSGNYNDLSNRPTIPAAGGAPISRSIAVTANSQAGTVVVAGFGTPTDLAATTATVSAAGDAVTIGTLGGFKVSAVSVNYGAGFNTGTVFTINIPDPFGAASIDAHPLGTLMHYAGSPATEQTQLYISCSLAGGVVSLSKSNLTAGAAARWRAML